MSNLGGSNVSEDTDKDGSVTTIVAGTNIDNIDSSDPRNPIINAAAGSGEANTASNVGGETGEIFKQKTGVDLELKTIKQGSRITITNNASDIEVAADLQLKNTTKGDLEGFSTVAARIPVGTDTHVLTADSGEALGIKWAAPAGGFVDPLTTKGDLTGFDTATNRVPVGTDAQVLTADSAQTLGVKWATPAGSSAAFHGVLLERTASLARNSSFIINDFTAEAYDTDAFADLGTNDDRITVPADVTKVQVTATITGTSLSGNRFIYITQYDSSDVQIRVYEMAVNNTYTSIMLSLASPVITVSSGDYFELTSGSTDASWTQTYVAMGLEYKDGTL